MSAIGYSEILDEYADFFAQPQELLSSVMRQIDELHARNLVLCPLHLRQGDVDAGGRTNLTSSARYWWRVKGLNRCRRHPLMETSVTWQVAIPFAVTMLAFRRTFFLTPRR